MNEMEANYIITHLAKDEMSVAIDWAKREGWNPGLYDKDCFYQTDPQGFFGGKLNGKIVALGSAVIYDDDFAFCGFYMVDPAFRGRGFGMALTKERLAYIGQRNAGLDGVLPMVKKYEQLGYQLAYHNARYSGTLHLPKTTEHPAIQAITQIDFKTLAAYDRRHFPAPRNTFLRCWIQQPKSKGFAYLQEGVLKGYGVMRSCYLGYKIGPLFADTPVIAHELFVALVRHANKHAIFLDIPECNPYALELVKRYGLEKVFATARMYLKSPPLVTMEEIYGITSFELG